MKVLNDGSRLLTQEEWNSIVIPAIENSIQAKKLLEEIKSVNTDKTNFKNTSSSKAKPIKEVS